MSLSPPEFMKPSNPNATPEARALLEFLYAVNGEHILAGQHDFISSGTRYSEEVFRITGRRPAVWGSDFSFALAGSDPGNKYHCGPLNLSDPGGEPVFTNQTPEKMRSQLVKRAIEMHRRGHIITLMWHACFPSYGDEGAYEAVWTMGKPPPSPETWDELLTPGSRLNTRWKKQLDTIASCLAQLRDARVPVLWRPYHEMNGVWFWWGNRKGPEGFSRLWIALRDYFSGHHQLHNLLWVWNANAPRDRPGDEAYDYAAYYPKGEYADVLAADVYRNDYRQSHHDRLAELAGGKPIALGEVGQVPLPQILRRQRKWTWFMPWGHILIRSNKEESIRYLYDDRRTLSLENIARDARGRYRIIQA